MADTKSNYADLSMDQLELQLKKSQLAQQIKELDSFDPLRQYQIAVTKAKYDTSANNAQEFTDIFKQQASINQSLIEVLTKTNNETANPTYVTANMPAESSHSKPNYVLYIALAAGAYFLFFRKKNL